MSLQTLPDDWDIVVVGAGVAGSVTALRLARRGLRVLLAEKSAWPRDKACGGCLNAAALKLLEEVGLDDICHAGAGYTQIHLASDGRQAILPLPPGRAVSRRQLDDRLARHATGAGAVFLPETQAVLVPESGTPGGGAAVPKRHVMLRHGKERATVTTRLVIGCDGLGSRLLRGEASGELQVAENSRIGVGTTLNDAPAAYPAGAIHMACGEHGYVGLVRVEDDRLNIGAALDPAWIKHLGGPGAAVSEALRQARFPRLDVLHGTDWQGTPQLTRQRSRLGGDRILVLGDAAGYVEPFTGEGMSWALSSAAAIEPLALRAMARWEPDMARQWTARHAQVIGTRQRGCRGVAAMLRRPRLITALLPLLNTMPGAVVPLAAWLNRDYRLDPREAS